MVRIRTVNRREPSVREFESGRIQPLRGKHSHHFPPLIDSGSRRAQARPQLEIDTLRLYGAWHVDCPICWLAPVAVLFFALFGNKPYKFMLETLAVGANTRYVAAVIQAPHERAATGKCRRARIVDSGKISARIQVAVVHETCVGVDADNLSVSVDGEWNLETAPE
jgi:hypothetical protein